jgi:hypothetical protein
MEGQSQTVHANEIKAMVGAASPDGRSPISISGIQLDPSVGTVGRGQVGGTWQFQWQGPATGQTHYATVTFDNGTGRPPWRFLSSTSRLPDLETAPVRAANAMGGKNRR